MLNNYDFNHTENNNEMENETNTYQPLTPSGSHNNNKKNPKNSKKLAKKIGVSKKCLYSRLKGETSFKQEEIQKIASILGLNEEKIMNIFFAELVS